MHHGHMRRATPQLPHAVSLSRLKVWLGRGERERRAGGCVGGGAGLAQGSPSDITTKRSHPGTICHADTNLNTPSREPGFRRLPALPATWQPRMEQNDSFTIAWHASRRRAPLFYIGRKNFQREYRPQLKKTKQCTANRCNWHGCSRLNVHKTISPKCQVLL